MKTGLKKNSDRLMTQDLELRRQKVKINSGAPSLTSLKNVGMWKNYVAYEKLPNLCAH